MLIKILIVDDSASDLFIIKSMLDDYGIITASDGVEALQMLEEHEEINLMILDLNMPNMDGFKVLEALKANDRYKNLRTIILTNYDELDNEIKGLRQGAVDYIRKPINMDSLKARIDIHASLLRAEHALAKKLEEQTITFDMIFDQAPIGIAISYSCDAQNPDGSMAEINYEFEKITGRTKKELITLGWAKISHPDDLREEMVYFSKLQAGEIKKYSMEKRFLKPDGAVRWVYMVVATLSTNNGKILNNICLIQDITNSKAAIAALIENEKKYRSITENMSEVVWQMDLNQKTTYISPSVEKLLGESVEEHMKRKMEEKFPEQSLKKFQSILFEEMQKEKAQQGGMDNSLTLEVEQYKADGTLIWVEMNVSFIRDDIGNAVGFQGSSRDISQRKAAETALIESERSKSVLLSNLPGMAFRCDHDGEWTMKFVSDGCYNLTGYSSDSFVNNKDLFFNDLISPKYRIPLRKARESRLSEKLQHRYEYEITTVNGDQKWVLELGEGVYGENGAAKGLEGIILDISEQKEAENHLLYINEHDKWTGLYNRDYLEALLNIDLKKNDGINRAIISINLSTVQLLTANYGFNYTQNLVKTAAETLSQYCNATRLLFNTYENRFVFYLIDYKSKDELVEFSKVIAESLENLFVTERIGGGIGILEIKMSDTEIDVDLLLRRLLIASERSIDFSENDFEVCFYNDELEAAINREGYIRTALAETADKDNCEELFLQYQPIWDLRTDSICGFEALARLNTEKLGLVPPAEFIPIAEKTKLIIPIGEKVIINTFSFLNKLKTIGCDEIVVSFNVSAIQLLKPDFTMRLFKLISQMQVNPKSVGIEITESLLASDYEKINNLIGKLREAGLQIAIDDFGTGYSSLAREKELKVDCLKIDKYFIDKLLDTDPKKTITSDIISMSHKLGHSTIAEGVENEIQLKYLIEHNCDMVQGFHFSKPLYEEDAINFMQTYKNI